MEKQYYLDMEAELYLIDNMANRFHDPGIGKFISEDPVCDAAADDNLLRCMVNDPTHPIEAAQNTAKQ